MSVILHGPLKVCRQIFYKKGTGPFSRKSRFMIIGKKGNDVILLHPGALCNLA
jgi:hypothetical protein